MQDFTRNTIEIILQIPPGRVMTYGQISKLAGSPRGARQVVRILHSMSGKYKLPWHRVVNAKGEVALRDEEGVYTQKLLLEREGITFNHNGRIDLVKYRYHPI
ncbi:MGMT family protein [Bacillus suaedaesalsae]|uniref:MGMT family protein n=1 Tax=Bacillus suaedaesalsae TaxID=2810349 RepID=A0ABS2DG88_9BACI|nr:MGMT family protein [Bacillus suaedaesalsae]MBM6616558.1 MGMT family protein [Bacillus suaedaesalsae]